MLTEQEQQRALAVSPRVGGTHSRGWGGKAHPGIEPSQDRAGRSTAQRWLWDGDVREEPAPMQFSTLAGTYPGSRRGFTLPDPGSAHFSAILFCGQRCPLAGLSPGRPRGDAPPWQSVFASRKIQSWLQTLPCLWATGLAAKEHRAAPGTRGVNTWCREINPTSGVSYSFVLKDAKTPSWCFRIITAGFSGAGSHLTGRWA